MKLLKKPANRQQTVKNEFDNQLSITDDLNDFEVIDAEIVK